MSFPLVKLGSVCTLINGDRGKNYPSKDALMIDGIPFINAGNLTDGNSIYCKGHNFISEERYELLSNGKIKLHDILFCLRGSLGKFAIVDETYPRGAVASSLVIIRCNKNIDNDYLKNYLKSTMCTREINKFENGAAQPNLSATDLKDFEIPLPYPDDPEKSLKEQKRIAAILDKADGIRRKRQQAIQLADDFLRSVFLDMFGDPVTNSKGWEVKPLKELSVKVSSGSTPKGGSKVYVDKGIHFFRSQNVWKNDIRMDDIAFIDKETHASLKKSSLKHKDILMTKTGRFNTENSSLGRAALFLGKDDSANVNGHVYLIRLKEKVLHEFIVFILTSIEYREHIRNVCVGGIDKRQLNKDHIENFPIICPPEAMKIEFMKKLSAIHRMRESAKLGLKEAQPLFNTLSQKAFRGEL